MKNNTPAKQASDGRPGRGAPTPISRKDFAVEVKALDDSGAFEIYAAVFGNVDRQGDVIQQGAFRNIPDFIKTGWIATNHDNQSLPVALVDTAVQDSYGLKISGRFHSTPEAQACRTVVRERMAAGKAVLCSIGYRTIEESTETRNGKTVNVLKTLDIYEASFVNLPANPAAGATSVKSETGKKVYLKQVGEMIEGLKAGRTISAANHTKLKDFAKGLHTHGKAACEMAKGLKEFLAGHGPVDDDDDPLDEPDGDGDEAEGDEKPTKKPTKKSESDDLSVDRDRLFLASLVELPSFEPDTRSL